MRKLIFNDGTEIEGGEAGLSGKQLWLFLPGYTFQQAAEIALDQNKTAVIIFEYSDELADRYEGYVNCTAISVDYDQTNICLERGES